MRETKNWSQEEMAEKLNMSVSGYSKIERGETNPHISKLKQIAQELEIDWLELMSEGRHVYLINDNSSQACNVIGSTTEIAFEMQKLQMQLSHKDETIEQLRNENKLLKEMVELMKKDD
jgi:transcriptional regulator with XRE-family HTH domain